MTDSQRRIAVIGDASSYVGPELARHLAARHHDLVLGDPGDALVAELREAGSEVVAVPGVRNLSRPESAPTLFAAALDRFGRVDAAVAASGRIVTGRFVDSTLDDLQKVVSGCLEAPYHFLKAAVPPMVERGEGQILVITSASGARPTPGAPLYSAARAGATMLTRNVAGPCPAPSRSPDERLHSVTTCGLVGGARLHTATVRLQRERPQCPTPTADRSSTPTAI